MNTAEHTKPHCDSADRMISAFKRFMHGLPVLLLSAAVLFSTGCTAEEAAVQESPVPTVSASPVPSETPATEPAVLSPAEAARQQYASVIAQADSYTYASFDTDPSGAYRYALELFSPEDTIPVLLLEQESDNGNHYCIFFIYDEQTAEIIHPARWFAEGNALIAGYRASMYMEGDGNGLLLTETSSRSGNTDISRITIKDGFVTVELQWEGKTSGVPQGISYREITWYDAEDPAGLDQLSLQQ